MVKLPPDFYKECHAVQPNTATCAGSLKVPAASADASVAARAYAVAYAGRVGACARTDACAGAYAHARANAGVVLLRRLLLASSGAVAYARVVLIRLLLAGGNAVAYAAVVLAGLRAGADAVAVPVGVGVAVVARAYAVACAGAVGPVGAVAPYGVARLEVLALVPANVVVLLAVLSAVVAVRAWHGVVHLRAVGVARVHLEHHAVAPFGRRVEVVGLVELAVLHGREHEVDVVVAAAEVRALDVLRRVYRHEVVEVDFVHGVILRLVKPQLVGHLVGEEQCFLAGLVIAHGPRRQHSQCHDGDDDKTSHLVVFFIYICKDRINN